MARRARGRRRGHVRSRQSKPGGAVVERGPSPAGCGMTSGAVRRGKSGTGSGVHGIIRLLPSREVALRVSAIGRGNRQTVVVVSVAEGASHICMSIGQKEPSRAVVERCRRPTHRIVASRAVCNHKGRAGGWVDRIRGLLPGRQMALRISTIGRRNRQSVIITDMAESASHARVPIG
jgi:hypothetical protein